MSVSFVQKHTKYTKSNQYSEFIMKKSLIIICLYSFLCAGMEKQLNIHMQQEIEYREYNARLRPKIEQRHADISLANDALLKEIFDDCSKVLVACINDKKSNTLIFSEVLLLAKKIIEKLREEKQHKRAQEYKNTLATTLAYAAYEKGYDLFGPLGVGAVTETAQILVKDFEILRVQIHDLRRQPASSLQPRIGGVTPKASAAQDDLPELHRALLSRDFELMRCLVESDPSIIHNLNNNGDNALDVCALSLIREKKDYKNDRFYIFLVQKGARHGVDFSEKEIITVARGLPIIHQAVLAEDFALLESLTNTMPQEINTIDHFNMTALDSRALRMLKKDPFADCDSDRIYRLLRNRGGRHARAFITGALQRFNRIFYE